MSQDICEVLLTAIDILDERRAQISAVDDFTAFDSVEEEKAVAVASNPFGDILLQEQMQMESGTISVDANSAQRFTWPVNGIDKGYDRLAISIKAEVAAKGSGNYGMRFTFVAANKDLSAAFDSSEFLGTPWMVEFDMLQKKLFDLSSLIDIQRIVVEFYNNSDKAVTFKEVSAILGYDLTNYSERANPLTLYVEGVENSELKYVTNAEGRLNATMSPDKIMINARWIYKEGDSARAITAANPGDLPEGAFIRWYKYCEEAPRGDQYGGSYYGLITNPNNNSFLFQLDSGEFLTNADKTQIKAVIIYGEETYTSNLVVIKNDKSKSDEFFQNRGITLEDGSSGIYAYYDFDNNIKEDFALETAVDRVAKVTYKKNFRDTIEVNSKKVPYYPVSKTIWKIPNGLLTYSGSFSSAFTEDGYDILETDGYVESITYRIKDAIPQTVSAYKIICIIYGLDGVQYTFEKEVSLILASNSGNPVIIRLLKGDKVVHAAKVNETYTISASIYNEKGEKIAPIYNEKEERIDSISINYAPVAGISELNGNTITIADAISSTGAIIKAIFQLSERNRVEEYFTIPVTNDVEVWYKGPNSIVYASTGCDPVYGTGECYLYKNGTMIEGITWGISKYKTEQSDLYIPAIGGNILTPKNSYDSSMDKGYYLTASKDNNTIWIQPIAAYINPYFSRIINDWDGSFKIDENGNYILASAYVAGSKEDNGTFTGAILGELGTIADKTSKTSANTGLFGYQKGAQSFGLKADGTAFFGKSGAGQIKFDGNGGIIESGNFKDAEIDAEGKVTSLGTGSQINLKNGSFNFAGGRLVYNGENTVALRDVTLRWEDVKDVSGSNNLQNVVDAIGFTQINQDGIIAPKIDGGYLHISGGQQGTGTFYSVLVDPQEKYSADKAETEAPDNKRYIFRISSFIKSDSGQTAGRETLMGVDTGGNAYFKGKIISTAGDIAGWKIGKNSLVREPSVLNKDSGTTETVNGKEIPVYDVDVKTYGFGLRVTSDDLNTDPLLAIGWNNVSTYTYDNETKQPTGKYKIVTTPESYDNNTNNNILGDTTPRPHWANAPFCVYHDGRVKATKLEATGEINATSGSFGTQTNRWHIGSNETSGSYLYNNDDSLSSIHRSLTIGNATYLGTNGLSFRSDAYNTVLASSGLCVGTINTGYGLTYHTYICDDRIEMCYHKNNNLLSEYETCGLLQIVSGQTFNIFSGENVDQLFLQNQKYKTAILLKDELTVKINNKESLIIGTEDYLTSDDGEIQKYESRNCLEEKGIIRAELFSTKNGNSIIYGDTDYIEIPVGVDANGQQVFRTLRFYNGIFTGSTTK